MSLAGLHTQASNIISKGDTLQGTTYTNNTYGMAPQYININPDTFLWNGTIGVDTGLGTTISGGLKVDKIVCDELQIKKKKKNMDSSNKYFRVLQDTPAWKKGALLVSSCGKYTAVGELFNQEHTNSDYHEFAGIVENAKEWFGRVYQVKVDGKTKYLPKEEAKKVIEAEIQY